MDRKGTIPSGMNHYPFYLVDIQLWPPNFHNCQQKEGLADNLSLFTPWQNFCLPYLCAPKTHIRTAHTFKEMTMEEMNPHMEDMNTDENVAGTTHLNERLSGEDELEKQKEELQAQKDKYLRLVAEFDNFRKRSARENLEIRQTAGKEI